MRIIECLTAAAVLSTAVAASAAETSHDTPQNCALQRMPERLHNDSVLCEFQSAWMERFDAGNFVEAADLAKRYVSQSTLSPEQRAFILERLARAERRAGDIEQAVRNYTTSIQLIGASSDQLDPRLVAPLEDLGRVLLDAGRSSEAAVVLERAAHITRVEEGPFNLWQSSIVDGLVQAYVEQTRYDKALAAQSHKLEGHIRAYGIADERIVDSLRQQGDLYTAAGMTRQAQDTYKTAIDIVRTERGYYSESLLPLLDLIAESYLNHGMNERVSRIGVAKQYIERKVIIVNKNPDIDSETRAAVYLQMGDFLQKYSGWEFAMENYRYAWDELGELGEADQRRARYFDQPAVLIGEDYVVGLRTRDPAAIEPHALGWVEVPVVLDVSEYGEAKNVRIATDDELPSSHRVHALRLARKFRFRPRIIEANNVDAPDQYLTVSVPIKPRGTQIASEMEVEAE